MQTDRPAELEAPPGEHPATLIAETSEGTFELERRANATNLFWRPNSRRSRLVDERLMLIADTMRGLRRVLKGQNGRGNFDLLEQGNGSYFVCALAVAQYYGNHDNRSGTCRIGWLDEQDLIAELEGPAKQPQHDPDVVDAVLRHKRKLLPPRSYPTKPSGNKRRTLADVQPPAQPSRRRTLK